MGVPTWSIAHTVGPFAGVATESTLDEELIGSLVPYASQWYWTDSAWMVC